MHRRDFLRVAGLVGLAGLASAAGCTTAARRPAARAEAAEPTLPVEPDYGDWFQGVGSYDATVDRRGADRVTVRVGAPGNLGPFGFEPAAVAVSPGATVVWAWTGDGGGHNVVAEDGSFASGPVVDAAGHTFERGFDAPGVRRYFCEPHRDMGMRGAVAVLTGEPGT